MIYPKFLKRGDNIGICAPSAGIYSHDEADFDLSLSHLTAEGYGIKETANVRVDRPVSASPEVRGAEFNSLVSDGETSMVLCATGGDFLSTMLPHVDFDALAKNPKWVQGYSDPTFLLYSITTKLDIATLYGANAGGFGFKTLHPSQRDGLEIIKGNIPVQHSFELYERDRSGRDGGYNLTENVKWESERSSFKASGRLIGGCLDCITDILGTEFDGSRDFTERYKDDGFIWYFDVFALKAEQVHNVLFKMRHMGLFENTRAVIFGRVCFPGTWGSIDYKEAAKLILGDIPTVFEADIGHVPPKFTIINGALGTLEYENGAASLTMELK